MEEYLKDCTGDHTYFKCNGFSVDDVAKLVEEKYNQLRTSINGFLMNDTTKGFPNLCYPLKFEPYVIPRIYGNIKVHKESLPVRPIISSVNCLGDPLMKWLLAKLNIIGEHLNAGRILNSIELFDELNGMQLDDDHELVNWDYDSMYTNIPISIAKSVIREHYGLIETVTSVPVDVFIEAITFFTEHSTYFLHNTGIYRQCRGLAMGNSLSKILAEIVTRSCINEAVKKFSNQDVRFLRIYVDDILGVMNKEVISYVEEEILKGQKFLKLKIVRENEQNEVNFLNMTIQRTISECGKFKLSCKWFQKECSAERILDYQSSHPLSMKRSICDEYIKNALMVSDKVYWGEVKEKLRSIFSTSNYPGRFVKNRIFNVEKRINSQWKIKEKKEEINGKRIYISFPYNEHFIRRSKHLVKRLQLKNRISFSPRIMRRMKQNIFSRLKCKLSSRSIINATAKVHCANCGFSCKIAATCFDLKRSFQHLKNNEDSLIAKHLREFPGHTINDSFRRMKTYRSRYDMMCLLNGHYRVNLDECIIKNKIVCV